MAATSWTHCVVPVAVLAMSGRAGFARAADPLEGAWETPLGTVLIEQTAGGYLGKLQERSSQCGFPKGAEVLRGQLVDDLFSGELRVCYPRECKEPEAWLFSIAARAENGAKWIGAAVPGNSSCANLVYGRRPFELRKRVPSADLARPAVRPQALRHEVNASARALFNEGYQLATQGRVEAARRSFERAQRLDPTSPEILKQIGITYYMRNDFATAKRYYLSALEQAPDFDEVHYNLACALAREGHGRRALASLRRAVELGFGAAEAMNRDPDLESVRGDPVFQEILRAARANAGRAQ